MILIIFDEVCFSMRNYFEDAEYRRDIRFKWNNLILRSMMTSYEDKSIEECLQLLIKQLRHLQHGLNSKLRSEKFIHNKLINACQDVSVCQYVCFKLSDSLVDLINDLRSSIIIYQKANSIIETFETFSLTNAIIRTFYLESITIVAISRRRNAACVKKRDVDSSSIQKMNAKRQSRNSRIVSIVFSLESITTSLNMRRRISHLLIQRTILILIWKKWRH
jgi:hypothetical protein